MTLCTCDIHIPLPQCDVCVLSSPARPPAHHAGNVRVVLLWLWTLVECRDEAQRLKNEGTTAYRARDFARALELYTAAREANPDPSDISFQLNEAAVHFENKAYDRTIEVCNGAIELGREHRAAFALLAKVCGFVAGVGSLRPCLPVVTVKGLCVQRLSRVFCVWSCVFVQAYARIGNAHAKLEAWDAAIEAYEKSLMESHSDDVHDRLKKARVTKRKAEEAAYVDPVKAEEAKTLGNEAFK
jgi:stress-induced-phosphoprotein 1